MTTTDRHTDIQTYRQSFFYSRPVVEASLWDGLISGIAVTKIIIKENLADPMEDVVRAGRDFQVLDSRGAVNVVPYSVMSAGEG